MSFMKTVRGGRSALLMAILFAASVMGVIPRLRGGALREACAAAHIRHDSTLSFMCAVSSDANPAAKLSMAKASTEFQIQDIVPMLSVPASQRAFDSDGASAPYQPLVLHLKIRPPRSDGQEPFI